MDNSVFDFCAMKPDGTVVDFNIYQGKVLLIVNTASACGFTPQYQELEIIYQRYKARGFEVLAFPSNDFGKQEKLKGKELDVFCRYDQRLSFPIFDRIHVKGKKRHPLFQYLGNSDFNGVINSKPLWNFHKYLLGRDGKVKDYFYSFTKPTARRLVRKIESLL